MRVALAPIQYDIFGHVEIDILPEDTDFGSFQRRVNRIATLDGGSVFNDFGFSYSDKSVILKWDTKPLEYETLITRLLRIYPLLRFFSVDGVYEAVPENYTTTQRQSILSLLIKDKVSE